MGKLTSLTTLTLEGNQLTGEQFRKFQDESRVCSSLFSRKLISVDLWTRTSMVRPEQYVQFGFFAITFERNRVRRNFSHASDPHIKGDKKYFENILDTPTLISSNSWATPRNFLKTGRKSGFWTKTGISRQPAFLLKFGKKVPLRIFERNRLPWSIF